jgi:hypothetical protein
MEFALDRRIAQVIARRRQEMTGPQNENDSSDRDRQLAHRRLVSELPRFVSMLTNAVAELNDRIGDAAFWIKLKVCAESPTAEASYTLCVVGARDDAPTLSFNVDFAGTVRALLVTNEVTSHLSSLSIFLVDRNFLMANLVELLEAQFH